MTQLQEVLLALARSGPSGLSKGELLPLVSCRDRSLRTVLSDAKGRGIIAVVGGSKGGYRYGLTELGREHLPSGVDIPSPNTLAFGQTSRLAQRVDEYRKLRRFVDWLLRDKRVDFSRRDVDWEHELTRLALEYLGVDLAAWEREREALESLLAEVRSQAEE